MNSSTVTRTIRASRWTLLAALCILISCLLLQACANKASPAPSAKKGEGGGAVPVTVTRVQQKDVPIEVQVVGNVEAYVTVSVKAQVAGQLTEVFFKEGAFVKKGDKLFTIDPSVYDAQLNQAKANLAKDEAQLGLSQANLTRDEAQEKYAQSEAKRYEEMLEKGLVSREQAEQYRTNADAVSAAASADRAAIQSAEATVKATEAALENAKLMLGYTTIPSPLDGRTGNVSVKQGNVISANTTELLTITQVEPIYVTFSVPETQLGTIKLGQMVTAVPQDSSSPPEVGTLTFTDNAVDQTTGTIRLKGTFPNSDHNLWPGEFVRVTLRLAMEKDALVVPNEAVQTGQDGSYVFVVKQDRTVESRPVVTGARVNQDLVIEKGLQAGEVVVTEGQLRLAPGSRVQMGGGSGNSPRGNRGAR
ncbi:MAG: efflux RND transporter periplasmic adaptor subunit [Acidobacteriota bacterium]